MLTTSDLDDVVYEAMRAGASLFLVKDANREQLAYEPGVSRPRDVDRAPTA
jgi:DNA-binding NarL/FixJ family response regulator